MDADNEAEQTTPNVQEVEDKEANESSSMVTTEIKFNSSAPELTTTPYESENITLSEDEYQNMLDRCWSDAIVKGGAGLIIGSMASVFFLRRRAWPAILSTGFGLGSAYQSCEKNMNYLYKA